MHVIPAADTIIFLTVNASYAYLKSSLIENVSVAWDLDLFGGRLPIAPTGACDSARLLIVPMGAWGCWRLLIAPTDAIFSSSEIHILNLFKHFLHW